MIIREAKPRDLEALSLIDVSYTTDTVWQMEQRSQRGQISVTFRRLTLPRPLPAEPPRRARSFLRLRPWEGYLLVAEEQGSILGYIEVVLQAERDMGLIHSLVVAPNARRQGIGTALLNAVAQLARRRGLSALLIETQTKNYPTISFCQKNGFEFCGFNGRHYANNDIAIFFTRDLRYIMKPT